jgi:hypothetical protein
MARQPTPDDLERMSEAVSLVASYEMCDDDYRFFVQLSSELHQEQGVQALRAVSQFAWMLLETIEEFGLDKSKVLSHYGEQFTGRAQELREQI